jgi:hypothetical protein
MNRLYYIGPLYWITRDNAKKGDKVVGLGFMRQTAPPWKTGRGLHLRIGKYSFQIGLARNNKAADEEQGMLVAVNGRFLEMTPSDIGDWR